MLIAFACDHGGFPFRESILEFLKKSGYETIDLGPEQVETLDDFPGYANSVCDVILSGKAEKGILICGTGIGMSIAANRHTGIRAVLSYAPEIAKIGRSHNDANVICFGARTMKIEDVL